MATRSKPTKGSQIQQAILYPLDWLEERSGLVGGVKYFLFRKVPGDVNWFQTLGSATLTAFLVQALTGVILAMYYKPDPTTAYPSIQHITNDLWAGWLVRGMHRWGASVFIILMFMHMGRVFLFGAYKYPRELNWIIGVLLLAMGLAEGFTGYLLPWDQTAYWATIVGININGTAPFLGPFLAQFLQGGTYINADTLVALLRDPHAADPRRDRRADRPAPVPRDPPRRHLAAVVEGSRGHGPDRRRRPRTASRPLRPDALHAERPQSMAERPHRRAPPRLQAVQGGRQGAREAVLPVRDVARHDHVARRRVVIIGLAIVWKYSTPGRSHTAPSRAGSGSSTTSRPTPARSTSSRGPDWYFYFLFYLLRIFKWPDSVMLGTVGIPTIAARAAARDAVHRPARPSGGCSRRPVAIVASILVVISMGVLTYKGATAKEALGSELIAQVPSWAKTAGLRRTTRQAIAGAKLFAVSGCLNCHTYLGDGGSNLGAPDLTAEGAKNKGIAFQIAHLQCPACENAGSPDAVVRGPRRSALEAARDVPRGVQGPEVASSYCASRVL